MRPAGPTNNKKENRSTTSTTMTSPESTGMTATVPNRVGSLPSTGQMINDLAKQISQKKVKQPEDPQTTLLKAQQKQYQDYLTALPEMQKQMQEQYTQAAQRNIASMQKAGEQKMASRGLGYGGLNEAMKEQVTAQGQQQLASQLAQGNQGLLSIGDQIQSGGLQTGIGMQNQLQALANMNYQRALAQQQAENQQAGSLLGTLGTAGMLLLL